MGSEPSADPAPATPPVTGPRDKVRLQFRKDGSLRWLSHHDLMRTFERMLRRASVPFHSTRGFNPRPRLVFALSLPLGVIGRAELVEIELSQPVEPETVRQQLALQCPPGLVVLDARRIPTNRTAHVVGFTYGVSVPAARRQATREQIAQALAAPEHWTERTRPFPRRVNVRPFLRDLRLDLDTGWLEMDLRLTPAGTARPDEVLRLVGLADLLEAGIPLERVRLELREDAPSPEAQTPEADHPEPSPDTEGDL